MVSALILEPIDEMVAISVSPAWLQLPAEWRDGLAYWALAQGVLLQAGVRPVGAPRDVEWTFASTPQDALDIQLRHPCPDCQTVVDESAAILAVEPNNHRVIGIAQFTIDYLRTPEEVADRTLYRNVYRAYKGTHADG